MNRVAGKNSSVLFPMFDYVFGTAYFPHHCPPAAYGLRNEAMPEGILPQLAYPFLAASSR